MRIRVDEIPESGRKLHFQWDDSRLREFAIPGDPVGPEVVRPLDVDIELRKEPDHIHVLGKIEGVLRMECHRCLKPFLWTLEEPVDTYLLKERKVHKEDDGKEDDGGKRIETERDELDRDELEYEFFDGETVQIDQLVAGQVFLALPFKVLCSEDCRGICPGCGADLNEEPCACERTGKGALSAALEAAKDKLP